MLLIASQNGSAGMRPAWSILTRGGSAVDAVEAATRRIEDDPEEHTVGYGGYPNLAGEVELDASIMDGTTHRAGAVGGLKGYRAAISVARKVMEELPHAVLVGEGAARFAAELGFAPEDLLTDDARAVYEAGLNGHFPQGYDTYGPVVPLLKELIARRDDAASIHSKGTVNFIAQDTTGGIASATSSSGWPWKYPGRVGDSAVIGAGNYADTRFGAATCIGWGELAIRTGIARSVVVRLEDGHDLEDACRKGFAQATTVEPRLPGAPLTMLAVDGTGHHICCTTVPGRTYLAWTDGMPAYEAVNCTPVNAS